MKVLELFAGSRSIGKVAGSRNHEVFSVDIKDFDGIDLVKDIEYLKLSDIPFIPDMIWASPPCTTYSLAAISHHRYIDGSPRSDFAYKSDRLLRSVLQIISWFPNAKFYIENPRATMRKQKVLLGVPRTTVWYCRYGDRAAKPTDIWSNNIYSLFNPNGWQPRQECFNGNTSCHHEPAPRGSQTGTQGKKGNYERSKIPEELCKEIIISTEKTINEKL